MSRNLSVESLDRNESVAATHRRMRLLVGGVAAALLAGALAACAAIAGLTPFSTEDCTVDGCDASVHPKPGDDHGRHRPTRPWSVTTSSPPPGTMAASTPTRADAPAELSPATADAPIPPRPRAAAAATTHARVTPASAHPTTPGRSAACRACPASAPTACSGRCSDTTVGPGQLRRLRHGLRAWARRARTPRARPCRTTRESRAPTAAARARRPTGFTSCPFGHCNSASGRVHAPRAVASAPTTASARATSASRSPARTTSRAGPTARARGAATASTASSRAPASRRSASSATYACPPSSGYKSTHARVRFDAHELLLHRRQPVPERQVRPEREQQHLLRLHRNGNSGLSRLPGDDAIRGRASSTSGARSTPCASTRPATASRTSACASGRCIPSSHNGNCAGCTGTGTDDGHGCMPAPELRRVRRVRGHHRAPRR